MNVNDLSVGKVKIDEETLRNNRARLNTGPLETVRDRIDYIHRYGITEIDLSGGESSVDPNWFKILDYCSERFDHVSCLSHGGKFSNMEFLQESYDHGLREILFSLHGSNPDIHDAITNRKGSFVKIVQAIRNAKELGMVVRVNCTVYQKNYKSLSTEYVQLIKDLDPLEVNFITLNYWEDNPIKHDDEYINRVDYKEITDNIKKCIDQIQHVKYINVRYTPYCFMEGYEKYVCDQYQHIYDIFDWNKGILDEDIDTTQTYTDREKLVHAYKMAERDRLSFYTKKKECLLCKYFYICDGVENELAKHTEVAPVKGDRVFDVNHFRGNYYAS
jgi:MoaA/NifB/PqqE/SkfB family radical SAM enzyme